MNNELVSIIIPSYNSRAYLEETLGSVLSQSYDNLEAIVVDDCSTDDTSELIHKMEDSRIRYICLEKNHGGPSYPRNIGIESARGKVIFMFDSDDVMLPGKIQTSMQILEQNSDIGLIFTDYQAINEKGSMKSASYLGRHKNFNEYLSQSQFQDSVRIPSADAFRLLCFENYIGTSSVAFPKTVYEQLGGFDNSLTNADDRDMWFKITQSYDVIYLNHPLHQYRKRVSGVFSRSALKTAPNRSKVLQRQLLSAPDNAARKALKRLIAENYRAMGRVYRKSRSPLLAAKFYGRSLLFDAGASGIMGILKIPLDLLRRS